MADLSLRPDLAAIFDAVRTHGHGLEHIDLWNVACSDPGASRPFCDCVHAKEARSA